MIVEYLTFFVSPNDRAAWIEADRRTWTTFLSRQPGFVSKSVWVSRERPGEISAVIVWTDEGSWKSIAREALDAVDRDMGDLVRPHRLDVFEIAAHTMPAAPGEGRA